MACVAIMLALMAAFWACTVLTVFNGLRFLVLAIGVISLFFPLYNVCLVHKRIATNDDVEAAPGEMVEISTVSKTGGFIWGLLSMSVAAAGHLPRAGTGQQPQHQVNLHFVITTSTNMLLAQSTPLPAITRCDATR
ncbi:hypothetical protein BASA81_003580 [Batrachochytrium salamandrivorans]|nr:hypothetical protein BASA81_003580 [Batrachochytrium salamandrivorans]